jgi:hypothetical protein
MGRRRRTIHGTISLPAAERRRPRMRLPKPSAARLKLLEAEGEGVYMVAGPGEGKEVRGNEIAGVVLQGVTSRSEDWSCKNWYF